MNDQSLTTTPESNSVQNARSMKEVESQIVLAKRFPRDIYTVSNDIQKACSRLVLAKVAEYALPIGGKAHIGPSIRLAEAVAQLYQNIDFGVRETHSGEGFSLMEAYCWDLQTNVRRAKTFRVDHVRYSRAKGRVALIDPAEIDRMIANRESRQLRNCILGVIPKHVMEDAVNETRKALQGNSKAPIEDRIKNIVNAFANLSTGKVTKEMIEKKFDHSVDTLTEEEIGELSMIRNSLVQGASKRADWFDFGLRKEESEGTSKLNDLAKPKEEKTDIDKQLSDIRESIE